MTIARRLGLLTMSIATPAVAAACPYCETDVGRRVRSGFVDGILFHQVFQLHSMMSARLPIRQTPDNGLNDSELAVNLEINMFWDGIFHVATWTAVAIGVTLLWRVTRRYTFERADGFLTGSILLGFGTFNVVEGLINHHLLHLHHVTETPGHLLYDLLFLASGVVLIAVGVLLTRSPPPLANPAPSPS